MTFEYIINSDYLQYSFFNDAIDLKQWIFAIYFYEKANFYVLFVDYS